MSVIEEEGGHSKDQSSKESSFKRLEKRIHALESSIRIIGKKGNEVNLVSKKDISHAVNIGANKLIKKNKSLGKMPLNDSHRNSSSLA